MRQSRSASSAILNGNGGKVGIKNFIVLLNSRRAVVNGAIGTGVTDQSLGGPEGANAQHMPHFMQDHPIQPAILFECRKIGGIEIHASRDGRLGPGTPCGGASRPEGAVHSIDRRGVHRDREVIDSTHINQILGDDALPAVGGGVEQVLLIVANISREVQLNGKLAVSFSDGSGEIDSFEILRVSIGIAQQSGLPVGKQVHPIKLFVVDVGDVTLQLRVFLGVRVNVGR